MANLGMIGFVRLFPEQATKETRVFRVLNGSAFPQDEYGLFESYCPDPACDCRRVMLNVVGRHAKAILATVNYGFDRDDKFAGPFLDPLNPQSKYSIDLFETVIQILDDPAYVARLEKHYRQVKAAAADPTNRIQPLLKQIAEAQKRAEARSSAAPRRQPARAEPQAVPTSVGGQREEIVPKPLRPHYDEIVQLTDTFCASHLNDEYAQLCRRLTAALSRKRPSPLPQGRRDIWVGAIIYTIGSINFLFDKSQTPHLRADELCRLLGVKQSTTSSKARSIQTLLHIGLMDPDWTLPSRIATNPMAWMIDINGLTLDARYAPREIQEEALRRGLIPFLPT